MKHAIHAGAVILMWLALAAPSYGQGGTTATLSGIAVDASGGDAHSALCGLEGASGGRRTAHLAGSARTPA